MYSLDNYLNLVMFQLILENCAGTLVCRVARDQQRVARRIRRFRQLRSGRDIGSGRFFRTQRPQVRVTLDGRKIKTVSRPNQCCLKGRKIEPWYP